MVDPAWVSSLLGDGGGGLGVLVSAGPGGLDLGQAEVQDLGLAPGGHEDVGGLEVAVDDALGVGRLEGVGDLGPELQQRLEVEGPGSDPLRQGLALEQLHGDEVLTLVGVDGVDGADVGVVEGGGGPGLPLKALEHRGVRGQLRGQELEGYVAAELRVLGLVDDPHASAAELGGDPVVRHRLADHGRVSYASSVPGKIFVELRLAVDDGEVRIAAGPGPVVPPGIRGLAQGVEGLGLLAELTEDAGDVVENHRVVRSAAPSRGWRRAPRRPPAPRGRSRSRGGSGRGRPRGPS